MDNKEQFTEIILSYFNAVQGVESLYVFGSITGTFFSAESDIDIALDFGRELRFDEKLKYSGELSSLTGREIDLIDLYSQEGLLHYKIITEGKELKGSSENYLYHMKKALYFHADFLPQLNQLSEVRIQRGFDGS